MTPENATQGTSQATESTPENRRGRQAAVLTMHQGLLDDYAEHLSRQKLAAHAVRTYVSVVRGYLAWLESGTPDGDPLNDPAARDWAIRDYRSHLVTVAKRAPATVSKTLAALDNFYTWRGLGKCKIKRQEPQRRAPRALDEKAARRYLRAVEACPSARDRAIALVPLYAGARIAEVAALDVGDVRISARKGELHLVGKGEKSRDVLLHPKLREALAEWLQERHGNGEKALFPARRGGGRLTTDAIGDVISGITEKAGLEDHITAHRLRHTYGTSMIRAGVDIVTVAGLMGHVRLETTRAYVLPTEADLEAAIMTLPVDE